MLKMRVLQWMPRLGLGLGLVGFIGGVVMHGHVSPAPIWMHE
jgi:hypothetical protein